MKAFFENAFRQPDLLGGVSCVGLSSRGHPRGFKKEPASKDVVCVYVFFYLGQNNGDSDHFFLL